VRQLETHPAAFLTRCQKLPETTTLKSETDFFTAVFMCAVFHELMLTAAFGVTRRSLLNSSHCGWQKFSGSGISGSAYMALKLGTYIYLGHLQKFFCLMIREHKLLVSAKELHVVF
jgi:hypothetical protein